MTRINYPKRSEHVYVLVSNKNESLKKKKFEKKRNVIGQFSEMNCQRTVNLIIILTETLLVTYLNNVNVSKQFL